MTRIKRHSLLLALLVLCACKAPTEAVSQPSEAPTVVIVVRHAEKGAQPADDPSLSPAGTARTLALIEAVSGSDIGAIYATQYKRTRETVTPLATKESLEVTVLPVTAANSASYHTELAADILAKHRGKTVVVAGHSNTAPALVGALGGRTDLALSESQYDRMFIVVIPPSGTSGTTSTISVRYGARTE